MHTRLQLHGNRQLHLQDLIEAQEAAAEHRRPQLAHKYAAAAYPFDKAPEKLCRLWSERIDCRVHSFPRALHNAVCDVLRCVRRALHYVLRRADRSRLNAASAKGERDDD